MWKPLTLWDDSLSAGPVEQPGGVVSSEEQPVPLSRQAVRGEGLGALGLQPAGVNTRLSSTSKPKAQSLLRATLMKSPQNTTRVVVGTMMIGPCDISWPLQGSDLWVETLAA